MRPRNPGELDTWIELYSIADDANETTRNRTETRTKIATVRAKRSARSGQFILAGNRQESVSNVSFIIRYRDDVTAANVLRVVETGREYRIDPPEGSRRHGWLRLNCSYVRAR